MTNGSTEMSDATVNAERNSDATTPKSELFRRGGLMVQALFIIAIAFSSWQILTAAGIVTESSLHCAFDPCGICFTDGFFTACT